eukprot:m.111390 g.111390  ORF g.111390 m.111390 type:complete len:324 (-) comp14061_c0_seq3:18-989(-)
MSQTSLTNLCLLTLLFGVISSDGDNELCTIYKSKNVETLSQPNTLKNLYWIHFPKAGTSFGNTVLHYVCPGLPPSASIPRIEDLTEDQRKVFSGSLVQLLLHEENIGDNKGMILSESRKCRSDGFEPTRRVVSHDPITLDLATSRRGVAMFRHPVNRLISAYNHNKHAFGLPNHKKMRKKTSNVKEYVAWRGISSCQTKMMVGRLCAEPFDVTERIYQQAELRLSTSLAFIGLVEHWNLSICLFHAMFGGSTHKVSFENVRAGSKISDFLSEKGIHTATLNRSESVSISENDDPWDTRLYQAATNIFVTRLKQYGFAIPQELT